MYWNIVKREVKTDNYIKIIKTFDCYGIKDLNQKKKADRYARLINIIRKFYKKYYYKVEFDFE